MDEIIPKPTNQGESETPPATPAEPVVEAPKEPIKPVEEAPTEETPKQPESEPEVPKSKEPEVKTPEFIEVNGEKVPFDEFQKGYMRQKDYTQKTQELASDKQKLEQIKDTLSPPPSPTPEEIQPLTVDQLGDYLDKRDKERDQQTALKSEVTGLEEEFTGEDGRPKYDDQEILSWQKDNQKMYLSPREAYEMKNKTELMDFEIAKRLKEGGKPTPTETPKGGGEINIPVEKESFLTKEGEDDPAARRAAILESMEHLESTE